MRYDKIGEFELTRDGVLIVLCVGTLCWYVNYKYIVLFIILNPYQRKIELKRGFGHHVEGKNVDVNENGNVGSRKWFKVGGISYEGDRKCVEGNRNFSNVDGNPVMGRGKWNNGSRKTIDVKGKCFIVGKKNKISKKYIKRIVSLPGRFRQTSRIIERGE